MPQVEQAQAYLLCHREFGGTTTSFGIEPNFRAFSLSLLLLLMYFSLPHQLEKLLVANA
jgi:hypothetical protein